MIYAFDDFLSAVLDDQCTCDCDNFSDVMRRGLGNGGPLLLAVRVNTIIDTVFVNYIRTRFIVVQLLVGYV